MKNKIISGSVAGLAVAGIISWVILHHPDSNPSVEEDQTISPLPEPNEARHPDQQQPREPSSSVPAGLLNKSGEHKAYQKPRKLPGIHKQESGATSTGHSKKAVSHSDKKPGIVKPWSWTGPEDNPSHKHFMDLDRLIPKESRKTLQRENDTILVTKLVHDSLHTGEDLILEKVLDRTNHKLRSRSLKSAGRFLVTTKKETAGQTRMQLRKAGLTVKVINAETLTATYKNPSLNRYREFRSIISGIPGVSFVEGDHLNYISALGNDPLSGSLHGMKDANDIDIDADEGWSYATDCSPIQVGVIDTGADSNHPDLVDNLLAAQARNFSGQGNEPGAEDDQYHGTHVAGTIGATGNNGVGVAGVCWKVSIVPVKVLNAEGSGFTADIINGIEYLANQTDVKIINASLGGPQFSQAMFNAISAFTAGGGIFVAAAGNDGLNIDLAANRTFPANYIIDGLVTVAALLQSQNGLSGFSNFGLSVDIAAPGTNILSTFPEEVPTNVPGYAAISGTSMAAPHVAGILALAWSQKPDATSTEIIQALYLTADTYDNVKPVTGARKANLRKMLEMIMNVDQLVAQSWDRFIGTTITPEQSEDLKNKIRNSEYNWATWEDSYLASNDFSLQASQIYGSFIGSGENPHIETWRQQLKAGARMSDLKSGLAASTEFSESYQQKINRVTGLSSHAVETRNKWSAAILQGSSISALEQQLISSEFADAAYRDLYQELFGNSLSAATLTAIKNRLSDPQVSFDSIRKEFTESPLTLLRINEVFNEIHKRDATGEELAALKDYLGNNHLGSALREKIKEFPPSQ